MKWGEGLVWKGVYFRRWEKGRADALRREYKALKYLMMEHLENNVKDFIMPLFHVSESAFSYYVATPVLYSDVAQSAKADVLRRLQGQYRFSNMKEL